MACYCRCHSTIVGEYCFECGCLEYGDSSRWQEQMLRQALQRTRQERANA